MSIAGLATYQNRSMYYSVRNGSGNYDFGNGGSFMNQMLAFHREDSGVSQTEEGNRTSVDSDISSELQFGSIQGVSPIGAYGESKAYTRCITANIKTKEMLAHESDGQMVYSYQEEEKSFSIFINSDGKDKTYTIKGIDENGQEIEEEFDPYNLDPEMMDFPEFSALCMYIRQTDETADLMSKMVFTDTSYFNSIFDKGDRVPLLKDYAEEYREATPSLAELASKLFDAINEFFEKIAWNNTLSDDKLSMLLEDRDTASPEETVTPLNGMGTLSVGNMRYVMTASEVFKPGSDDAIVRVHVGDQDIDVNINEVDPKHASAVEMFAYCQYADAHDTGTGYTFGSYSVLNGIIDPMKKTEYASLDDAISKKSNWSEAISGSKVSFTKEYTKEKYDSFVLLKMLKETGNLFASRDMVENEIKNTELGLVSVDVNGMRYSNSKTNEIEWEIEFLNDKEYEKAKMIMDWVFQNNISSEFIKDKGKWSDFLSDKLSEASFKDWIQKGSVEDSEEIPEETEAERTKRIIQEYWESGKIKKAMDGYEFIKMQGEIIERNIEKLRKNQKTTRERLLEQDPNAASKWYMYDNGSKRYTFDEFCKFMDAKDAEARANAPKVKNPYLEMANYILNQRKKEA
ncbi:MAG: hypothetical protein J5476_01555 [Lachnospiraceae bacterium]|nr:hypothetical protein [Lachnospiraceae bacterium]